MIALLARRLLPERVERGLRRRDIRRALQRARDAYASDDDHAAVRWFSRAARQGDTEAAYELGLLYAQGRGVFVDLPEAVRQLRIAAEAGHPRAELELGIAILRAVESGPRTGAASWYRHASARDLASAERRLALFYPAGLSVEGDERCARGWVQRAAQRGLPAAQANLGTFCALGIGGQADQAEAQHWYRLAAEAGHIDACFGLGVLLANSSDDTSDRAAAAHWYAKAAAQGHDGAMLALGLLHLEGLGVSPDREAARKLLTEAAEHGNARACHAIGLMELDESYPSARARAEGWFRRGCRLDDVSSMLALAELLDNGDIGNTDEATSWYRRAAEQENPDAQFIIGTFYATGDRLPLLRQEAVSWFERAALQGHVSAQINLAVLYLSGEGIPKDTATAITWYRRAASQGDPLAQVRLGRLLLSDEVAEPAVEEAERWLREAAAALVPEAELELAQLYLSGRRAPRGQDDVAELVTRAAKAGLAAAQLLLGDLYAAGTLNIGRGEPDMARATYWYRAAIAGGEEVAASRLRHLDVGASTRAKPAATRQVASAQAHIGRA